MPESTSPVEQYTDQDLQDMLPIYYKRLFPLEPFFRWISYGSESSIFTHREFSFTLVDDVYIRYLSYEKREDFEADLCARNPFKIDIGAVMSVRPKDHRTTSIQAVQRELVFDIDMTDYDEVRTCCSGADICQKCWKFMTVACHIIDAALREDFGFEHILWVFSGRRGIHCWVCDEVARHMNAKNRSAVAEYLNIFSAQSKVIIGDRMHHSVKRAYRIVETHFEDIILNDQNLFGTAEGRKKLIDLIPDEGLRKDLESKLKSIEENDSKAIWEFTKRFLQNIRAQGSLVRRTKHLIEEIQLALLYPRLDIAVSKALNHLLKAPFCVHPKTGKICVPFNPNAAAKFDPTTVPTIRRLLKETDNYDVEHSDAMNESLKSNMKTYKKTAIAKSLFVFEEFLSKLEASFKNKPKPEAADSKMDF